MSIEFVCVHCQKGLRVTDAAAGKQARCPQCGTIQTCPSEPDTRLPPDPWPNTALPNTAVPNMQGTNAAASGDTTDSRPSPSHGNTLPGFGNSFDNPFAAKSRPGSTDRHRPVNPYQSPQRELGSGYLSRSAIQARIQAPATALLVITAISGIVLAMWTGLRIIGVVVFGGGAGRLRFEDAVNLAGSLFVLMLSGVIAWGALNMRRLQNYPLALTAAMLSVLPCATGCCFITVPLGIWTLVILLDQNVRAEFR